MGVLRGVSWRGVCVALLLLPGPSPTAGRVSNYTRAIDGDVAGARVHHTHAPAEPAGGASEEDATPHPHTSAGDRAGGDVRSRTRRPVGLVPAVVAGTLVPASDPTSPSNASAEPLAGAGVLRALQRRALDVEGRDEDHEAHARNQENEHGRDDQTHTAAATSKPDGDGDASQAHHEGHAETTEGAAAAAAAATTGAAATDSAAAQETTAKTTAADPGLVDPAEVE